MLRSASHKVSERTKELTIRKTQNHKEQNHKPEIRPQIHNLPCPQSHQHTHSPKSKPFHSFIRTLIRIPQFLFPAPEIFHLGHNLIDRLFDAAKLRLNRLQLLRGRDAGPVFGVGADVDVELDVAGGGGS